MSDYIDLADKSNEAEFRLKYDKSKPLKDQLIFKKDRFYLLNVSKTYVDNNYIGVTFFYFTDEKKVHKHFIDKFRYSEEVVEQKEKFLSDSKFKKFLRERKKIDVNKIDTYTVPFKLIVGNEIVTGEKVYANNTYAFSNFYFSNNVVCKGVYGYGYKKKFHKQNKLLEPTDNDLFRYAEQMKYTALQNVYTYVKTEYSQIDIII